MRRAHLPRGASCRQPAKRAGLAALLALSAVASAAADTLPSGAASCSGCHAPAGASGPGPSLSGRTAEEIATAMLGFRAGELPATVMDRIAKGFTDDEILAIAAWLAAGQGAGQ